MRVVRTTFSKEEGRRDRRYPLPPLVVAIDGVEYSTVNWSLGGFLLSGYNKPVQPGQSLCGTVLLIGRPETIDFTGMVLRRDERQPGNLAVQFTDLDERGITILDRVIARRLYPRRAGK